jgi:hypothetical protein
VIANAGSTALLRVLTAGTGMSFSWFKLDGSTLVPLVNPASPTPLKYLGLTTGALSVVGTIADDAGDYVCAVTGHGRTIECSPANLFIRFRPELLPVTFPEAIVGGSFTYSIPFNSDLRKTPVTFTASPLPAGLTLNANTGVISGRPTAAFNQTVNMTARNLAGLSDTVSATLVVSALPSYLGGSYVGLLPRTAAINAPLGARFEMTVASTGAASGRLLVGTSSLAFATGSILNVVGTNPASATATAEILVPRTSLSLPALSVTFNIDSSGVVHDFTVADSTNSSSFGNGVAWRNPFSTLNPATAYQGGAYNFALLAPSGSDTITIPQGSGHGSFTVSNTGTYTASGKAADGTTFTTSAFLSASGQALLYQTLYTTPEKGAILGVFTVNNAGNSDPTDNFIAPTSSISWNRPQDTSPAATPPTLAQRTYRAGFDAQTLTIEGSYYLPPTSPNVLLGIPSSATVANARVRLNEGGISSTTTSSTSQFTYSGVRIGAASAITLLAPNSATFTLSGVASTGKFSGSFIMRDGLVARPTTTFDGVIYKKDGLWKGAGFFLHSRKATGVTLSDDVRSGSVTFEKIP